MAKEKSTSDTLIQGANDRIVESADGADYNRDDFYKDMKFARLSEQWPDDILQQRKDEARPALTINKLPALIRSVVNEGRQNKPGIKVSPVDNGADEETAEVIGGLIRSIERNSNAEVAYDNALDDAVTGGFGFFRIAIDYAHDETFDLEARIERIPSALQVHWDVASTAHDASDWEYGFISDFYTKREFEERWPDASLVSFESDHRADVADLWVDQEQIRVAEYFLRTMKHRDIVMLAIPNVETGGEDFQTVRADQLPDMAKSFFEKGDISTDGMSDEELIRGFMEVSGVQERNRREVEYFKVMRHKINGVEELEEAEEWPGSTIPICPVWGDEVFSDGRRYFRSLIRDAKDSQLMFNFHRTSVTELVALAPKAPWIIEEGSIPKGQETKWKSANTRNHAWLSYAKGKNIPIRTSFAGIPAGALQEAINSNEDMQAITGIYPSAIGAQSNETSGKAILARERQGDVSNFHFVDNLSRAIRYAGQILVEIIPAVYSPSQTVRILGEDEAQNVVNLTQEAGGAYRKGIDGKPELYNLTVGKYDVEVKTGPSYGTQREETRETLIEIMRQVPDAAPFIGDVLLDHMDFVGADKLAKRLKHLLPEAIRAEEDEDVTNADNPEAALLKQQLQAKDAEMQQAKQLVMQEIEKIQDEAEQAKDAVAKLQADKTVEMERLEADVVKSGRELALKDEESDRKNRELELKEGEAMLKAQEETVTPEQQWEHDQQEKAADRDFETVESELTRQATAEQNALDRQADLAKVILSNAESIEGGEGGEQETTAIADAMMAAAEMQAQAVMAPKTVVRDPVTGCVTGMVTEMPEPEIEVEAEIIIMPEVEDQEEE